MEGLCFIIQARMGSTRLPGKMGKDFFYKQNIPELIIEKLQSKFPAIPIVLATTNLEKDDAFEKYVLKYGLSIFRGSESDVLQRFIDAGEHFGFQKIIRICADNPFLDMNQMQKLISEIDDSDYISYQIDGVPTIMTHFGFWAEYVTLEALRKIVLMTEESFYHEHVTNYIYSNPQKFNIKFLATYDELNSCNDIRMTIDTLDDFEILSKIYRDLNTNYGNAFGIPEIIKFLEVNPNIRLQMKKQITENTK